MLFLFVTGCDILFFQNDPIVARVRGRCLRTSDINGAVGETSAPQEREQFIGRWIDRQLWQIEAKKHVRINSELRGQIDEYKSSLLVREFQEIYVYNNIMVDESHVLKYYEEHQREFFTESPAAFVEIYKTPSRDGANEVLADLIKTELPSVPIQIKLVYRGDCVEPLDKALFSKNRKNIMGPISHAGQYYVLSIIEYYPGNSLLRVEHVRDDIIQKLQMTARSSAFQQKQKELRDHINVKIFKTSDR
ncbi:MAG: peptidyl-prolyl cis-trans isomerase [Candidatus Marinimicrobia bacterium]|nr:peptidyl-prolyl cis-trans isomerase [Candidatus Neomarinimicrobiota bacterium]